MGFVGDVLGVGVGVWLGDVLFFCGCGIWILFGIFWLRLEGGVGSRRVVMEVGWGGNCGVGFGGWVGGWRGFSSCVMLLKGGFGEEWEVWVRVLGCVWGWRV